MASADMAPGLATIRTPGLAGPAAAATRQVPKGSGAAVTFNDWLATWQGTQKSVAGSPDAAPGASAASPPGAGPAALTPPGLVQCNVAPTSPSFPDPNPPDAVAASVTTGKAAPQVAEQPIDPASAVGLQPPPSGKAPSAASTLPSDRKHKDVAAKKIDIASADDLVQIAAALPVAVMSACSSSTPAILRDVSIAGQTDPAAAPQSTALPVVAAPPAPALQSPALQPLVSPPIATLPADGSLISVSSDGAAGAPIAWPSVRAIEAPGERLQPIISAGPSTVAASKRAGLPPKAAPFRQAMSASVNAALPLLVRSDVRLPADQGQDSGPNIWSDKTPDANTLMAHVPPVAGSASPEPGAPRSKPGTIANMAASAFDVPDQSRLLSSAAAGALQEAMQQAPTGVLPSSALESGALLPITQSIRQAVPAPSSELVAVARADANTPDVTGQIMNAMVSGGPTNQLVVKLNPESLGPLQIEMTRSSSGAVDVRITVAEPHALHLLVQDLAGVHNALDKGGIASEGRTLTVQMGTPTDSSSGHAAATDAPIASLSGDHAASGWTQTDVPDARSASPHALHQQMSGGQSEAGRNFGGQNFGEAAGGYRQRSWPADELGAPGTEGVADPLTLGIDITA